MRNTEKLNDGINHYKLDNPAWYSLTETHQQFAISYNGIKFYNPDYCPFGGFESTNNISSFIDNYSALVDDFFIVGNMPPLSDKVILKKELVCMQMIMNDDIETTTTASITKLTSKHTEDLFQLVNLVQPGYFKSKTALLGNYYGIYNGSKLVAVAGERMAMNEFVEVSAIVTHPKFTGRGLAKQLIAHTVKNIFSQNKIPYLHVAETNIAAINLYKKSGFTTRRKISFWNIGKL